MQSPQLSSGQKLTIVAGKTAGKGVYATEEASGTIKLLKVASQKGDYDSTLILRGLESLTSGTQKDNVFISPAQFKRNPSNKDLTLIFRGVTVKARELDTSIVVYDFDVSEEALKAYKNLQKNSSAPGLYSVKEVSNQIKITPISSGVIKPLVDAQTKVSITDGGHRFTDSAGKSAMNLLFSEPGSEPLRKKGFIMHFTPGGKSFGGLRQLSESLFPSDTQRREGSALMLAQTMSKSKDIDGIYWSSEYGGSAVLTRSLEHCAKQNLDLSKHNIYLYYPTTSPVAALESAKKVNIQISSNFYRAGMFDVMSHASRPRVGRIRRQTEDDFTAQKEMGNLAKLGLSIAGLAGVAATITGYTPAVLTAISAVLAAKQAYAKLNPKHHNSLVAPFND